MTSSRIAALSAIAATTLMFGSLAASATCADSTGMHADSRTSSATTVGFNGPATTGSIRNRTASIRQTAGDSEANASSALGRSQWTGSVQLFW